LKLYDKPPQRRNSISRYAGILGTIGMYMTYCIRIESLEKACHIGQVIRYVLEQQISRKKARMRDNIVPLGGEEEMSPIARCEIYILRG